MKAFLTVLGILCLVFALSGIGYCLEERDDSELRLSEKRESFGMGIREDIPDRVTESRAPVIVPVIETTQPEKADSPDEKTPSTSRNRDSSNVQVTVKEVAPRAVSETRRSDSGTPKVDSMKKSAPVDAPAVESGSEEQATLSHRPDKIALMSGEAQDTKPEGQNSPNTVAVVAGMIWKLALVCGLAYILLLALKFLYSRHETRPQVSREVQLVDTVRLSPSSTVHVLDVKGRKLLIGCSSSQVNLLQELESDEEEIPVESPTANRFAEYLERYSDGARTESPASRVSGLLKDCTTYLRQRCSGGSNVGQDAANRGSSRHQGKG